MFVPVRSNIRDKKIIEKVLLLFFVVFLAIASYCHEPWFDEAQAWQIARSASYKDLLLVLPHYEGHPPFWHLLLSIPAKLGAPYELSLKAIAFVPVVCMAAFILLKSPFPRVLRCTLPFSYFFFYHYAVLSRPYSFLVFSFVLLASLFKERNEKPVRFVAGLAFVCMWSAYGIIFAGGIALAWCIDILMEKIKGKDKSVFTDRRVLSLGVLLVFALVLIVEIIPDSSVEALRDPGKSGVSVINILSIFFGTISECLLTDRLNNRPSEYTLSDIIDVTPAILIGIILIALIILLSRKDRIKYYLIPYLLFSTFATTVYFYGHHMGVMLAFTVFYMWTAFEVPDEERIYRTLFKEQLKEIKNPELMRKLLSICVLTVMSVSVNWGISSAIVDIKHEYFYGRNLAKFMLDHNMEHAFIFGPWNQSLADDGSVNQDIHLSKYFVGVLPYFDKDARVANLNMGDPEKAYTIHKPLSKQDVEKTLDAWREMGYPEVCTMSTELEVLFDDFPKYVPVYKIGNTTIWKGEFYYLGTDYLCVREDKLADFGATAIEVE